MPARSNRNNQNKQADQDAHWQQAWNEPEKIPVAKKQALLNGIHRYIDSYRQKRKLLFVIGISAAAAAILMAVFTIFPGNDAPADMSKWRELATNDSSRKVLLDDGSVLWLAPRSAIRIHPDFVKHRNTELVKGTVFYDISHDEQHPFSIAVNRQEITVLGTAFSIHKTDTVDIMLAVKRGKVALDNLSGRRLLTAGQQANTVNATTPAIQAIEPDAIDWWLRQGVRWHNISLEELLNRIENYYQVKLSYGTINRKMKLTLTWDLTIPLEDNLAVLNALTGYHIH